MLYDILKITDRDKGRCTPHTLKVDLELINEWRSTYTISKME